MTHSIQLIFWTTSLSILVTYAWWVRMRVWLLRQDLFNIRDTLWQQMRDREMLNDKSYQETRDSLNFAIHLAPYLSFPVLARLLFGGGGAESRATPSASVEISRARSAVVDRLIVYMLRESVAGLGVVGLFQLYRLNRQIESQFKKWITRLLESSSARDRLFSQGCIA